MRCKLFSIEAWPFEFYISSWCFHAMKERVTPITDVLRWTLDEMRSLMSPLVHFIQLTLAMSVSTRNFTAFSFFRGVQFDSKASTQSRGIWNLVFQWNDFVRQAFNVQYHYQSLLMTCSTWQKQLSEILVSTTAHPRRPPFLTVNLIGVKEEGEVPPTS